jgi:hypothetical protein
MRLTVGCKLGSMSDDITFPRIGAPLPIIGHAGLLSW